MAAYGISEVAASEILEGQCEKVEAMMIGGELEMSRKRARRFECENVDGALVEWLRCVDGKLMLSVAILLEQVRRRLAKEFGEKEEEMDRNWVSLWASTR